MFRLEGCWLREKKGIMGERKNRGASHSQWVEAERRKTAPHLVVYMETSVVRAVVYIPIDIESRCIISPGGVCSIAAPCVFFSSSSSSLANSWQRKSFQIVSSPSQYLNSSFPINERGGRATSFIRSLERERERELLPACLLLFDCWSWFPCVHQLVVSSSSFLIKQQRRSPRCRRRRPKWIIFFSLSLYPFLLFSRLFCITVVVVVARQ